MVDTPYCTEQTNERCCGTNSRQEGQAVLQAALNFVNSALDGHGYPGVQIDLFEQSAFMVFCGFDAGVGDEAEWAAFFQGSGTGLNRSCFPEFGAGIRSLTGQFDLINDFGDEDVPAAHGHDDHDDECAFGNEVTGFPESVQTVRIVDHFFGGCWGSRRAGVGRSWCRCGCISSRCWCRGSSRSSCRSRFLCGYRGDGNGGCQSQECCSQECGETGFH